MSWLWYQQGSEIAALRTDLDAAYAEVETLRSRPVVSETRAAPAVAVDGALVPAADAEDLANPAATLTSPAVSPAPVEAAPVEAALPNPAETAAATPATSQVPLNPPTPATAAPAISHQAQ
jgi:hypothetical protein